MMPNSRPPTSARAVSDYRKIKDSVLPEFELRKDLLRLRKASSDREREKILKRLAFYQGYRWYEERFLALLNANIKEKKSIERMLQFYRKRRITRSVKRTADAAVYLQFRWAQQDCI